MGNYIMPSCGTLQWWQLARLSSACLVHGEKYTIEGAVLPCRKYIYVDHSKLELATAMGIDPNNRLFVHEHVCTSGDGEFSWTRKDGIIHFRPFDANGVRGNRIGYLCGVTATATASATAHHEQQATVDALQRDKECEQVCDEIAAFVAQSDARLYLQYYPDSIPEELKPYMEQTNSEGGCYGFYRNTVVIYDLQNRVVAGFMSFDGSKVTENSLCTRPGYRNQHIGFCCMAYSIARDIQHGYPEISIHAMHDATAKICEHLGLVRRASGRQHPVFRADFRGDKWRAFLEKIRAKLASYTASASIQGGRSRRRVRQRKTMRRGRGRAKRPII